MGENVKGILPCPFVRVSKHMHRIKSHAYIPRWPPTAPSRFGVGVCHPRSSHGPTWDPISILHYTFTPVDIWQYCILGEVTHSLQDVPHHMGDIVGVRALRSESCLGKQRPLPSCHRIAQHR